MEIINCLCKVHEVLIIYMKTEKRKEKQTNLAKGRFIVQPRASVSMTTCSNFEIKWTVDSVRENKSGLLCWEDGHMHIRQHHDTCYQTAFLLLHANTGIRVSGVAGTFPFPGSISGRLRFNLPPDEHAALSMTGARTLPQDPSSVSTPLLATCSALLFSLK